jgi:hypothetical protein
MSASSDDAFYSAPDSSPSNSIVCQTQRQIVSTPLNPNPARAAQNHHSTLPPDKWLSRMALSAGKVISTVLGLSDGSGSDDESDGDEVEMLGTRKFLAPRVCKLLDLS